MKNSLLHMIYIIILRRNHYQNNTNFDVVPDYLQHENHTHLPG